MSDLISRKEALSLLTNLQLNGGDLADAKRFVAVMPTTYDIDKVVEQLEAELYRGMESLDTTLIAFNFGINIAINIVKKGGVSNETD